MTLRFTAVNNPRIGHHCDLSPLCFNLVSQCVSSIRMYKYLHLCIFYMHGKSKKLYCVTCFIKSNCGEAERHPQETRREREAIIRKPFICTVTFWTACLARLHFLVTSLKYLVQWCLFSSPDLWIQPLCLLIFTWPNISRNFSQKLSQGQHQTYIGNFLLVSNVHIFKKQSPGHDFFAFWRL